MAVVPSYLAGEPGIGKTTLIDAIEQDARDVGSPCTPGVPPRQAGRPRSGLRPGFELESLAEGLEEDQRAVPQQGAPGRLRNSASSSPNVPDSWCP